MRITSGEPEVIPNVIKEPNLAESNRGDDRRQIEQRGADRRLIRRRQEEYPVDSDRRKKETRRAGSRRKKDERREGRDRRHD